MLQCIFEFWSLQDARNCFIYVAVPSLFGFICCSLRKWHVGIHAGTSFDQVWSLCHRCWNILFSLRMLLHAWQSVVWRGNSNWKYFMNLFFMAKLFLKVICCATWKTTDVYCLYGNFYSSSPLLHSPEEFLFFLYFISCSSLTSLVTLWFSPCLETFCSCSHSYSLVLFHLCSWSHTNHLFR